MRVYCVVILLAVLLSGSNALPLPVAGAAAAARAGAPVGPQPFVTVLCKFADVEQEPQSRSYFEELLATEGRGLDAYWREVSYGSISLAGSRVAGWYTLPGGAEAYRAATATGVDAQRLATDCTAAARDVFFPDFEGINLIFNYPLTHVATGGKACLDLGGQPACYRVTWLWPGASLEQATVAHEMGHAFGLPHSSSGQNLVYASTWDVMSRGGVCGNDTVFGAPAQHVIAYDKDILGWLPPARKFVAAPDDAKTITLERLAQPGPDGYLVANIPIAGSTTHYYTVEARRRIGFDASLPGDAVIIHEVDAARPLPAHLVSRIGDDDTRLLAAAWTAGVVFQDAAHGIAVAVDAETATGFAVTITTSRGPGVVSGGDRSTAEYTVAGAIASVASRAAPFPASGVVSPAGTASPPPLTGEVVLSAAGSQVAPASADSAGRGLYVVWLEQKEPGGSATLQSARHVLDAPSAGTPWQATGQVNSPATLSPLARAPLAIAAGAESFAIWQNPTSLRAAGATTNSDLWFAHRPAGGAWEQSIRINEGADSAIRGHPAIAADQAGNAYAVWNEIRGADADIYFAFHEAGSAWGPSIVIEPDEPASLRWQPDIAVDEQGNSLAVWSESLHGHMAIHSAYRPAGGPWQRDEALDLQQPGLQTSPAVAFDGQGNAHAAWEYYRRCGGDLIGGIMYSSRPAGGPWGPPVKVAGDIGSINVSDPDIAVDRAGNAYVVWEEQVGAGFRPMLARRRADYAGGKGDAGGWGPAVQIGVNNNAAPTQAVVTVDGSGRAYVAWLDSSGSTRQVKAAEVQPAQSRNYPAGQ